MFLVFGFYNIFEENDYEFFFNFRAIKHISANEVEEDSCSIRRFIFKESNYAMRTFWYFWSSCPVAFFFKCDASLSEFLLVKRTY